MIDQIVSWTALPNLHPAIVHFPVAFLPLALAFEIAGLVKEDAKRARSMATSLYLLAAGAAAAAVWAGRRAADGLVGLPATVHPRIGEHSDWAHYALYSVLAVAALALFFSLRPSIDQRRWARALILVLGLGAMSVLTIAADRGGALVYQHGVGVQVLEPEFSTDDHLATESASVDEAIGPPADRLVERADGGLEWRPTGEDGAAIGEVLRAATNSSLDGVRALPAAGEGLRVAVDGEATLLLPGTFGDVMVEVEVELIDYEGSLGVVHHASGASDRGGFSVNTEGTAVLEDHRAQKRTELDRQPIDLPSGRFVLAVSAAGRHLKGLVDGRTVTHGHIAAGPDGSGGLRFEGQGTVRIVRLLIQPLM